MCAVHTGTRRLFVAAPLPQGLVPFATRAQAMLRHIQGVRFVDREQMHCTLAFLGEVDHSTEEATRRVIAALDTDLGGEAVISGFTFLPNARRARVVALGVWDEGRVLTGLFDRLMKELTAVGVMDRDARPFRPHITIARLKSPSRVQPMSDCGQAAFRVESVCLYASELRREGAIYSVLERKDLQRPEGSKDA